MVILLFYITSIPHCCECCGAGAEVAEKVFFCLLIKIACHIMYVTVSCFPPLRIIVNLFLVYFCFSVYNLNFSEEKNNI